MRSCKIPRFFQSSRQSTPMQTIKFYDHAYQYVENLITNKSEASIIPRELLTNEMSRIIKDICIIRVGIVGMFAFNNIAAATFAMAEQPEFCAAYFVNSLIGSALTYRIGNSLVDQAGDLVKNGQAFDEASNNALLHHWISQNKIRFLGFTNSSQLMFLSESKASEVAVMEKVYMKKM